MAFLYRSVLLLLMMSLVFDAMPAQAQTSATLNVTARVVEQCVISAKDKRRMARILRKTGRRIDLSQNCSSGVVSRVSERPVKRSVLRPTAPLPPRISKARIAKRLAAGGSDLYLVTVTY